MDEMTEDYAELLLTCVSPQSPQPLPSQPPTSPPLATIHDLPLEIIGRIITIAHPAISSHRGGRRERYRFIKATSLVSREWTPFAQEALWLDALVLHKMAESFLEAGAGRHATHRLSVECWRRASPLQAVLRDVRGVRDLELREVVVSMDWLCGDNFKGRRTRPFPVEADF
jgi:hypothetical protein